MTKEEREMNDIVMSDLYRFMSSKDNKKLLDSLAD